MLVDDLDAMQAVANEIEEQAVRLRQESIAEGTLPADFPGPIPDLVRAAGQPERPRLAGAGPLHGRGAICAGDAFIPGPRYGGRLKPFMDDLVEQAQAGDRQVIVSRQISAHARAVDRAQKTR